MNDHRKDLASIHNEVQADEFGPWPLNFVGRQWIKMRRQRGWRRFFAVAFIGGEVLLILVIIALLIL